VLESADANLAAELAASLQLFVTVTLGYDEKVAARFPPLRLLVPRSADAAC